MLFRSSVPTQIRGCVGSKRTLGFASERTTDQDHADLLRQLSSDDLLKYGLIPEFVGRLPVVVSVDPLMSTEQELQVWLGGPVETERSCMLVGGNPDEDSFTGMRIGEGLYLSTSPDLLRRLLEPNPPPSARLIVGYSGWAPGQLESELQESAWLISDVDRELIFDVEPERMWEKAMRRIGADPAGLHTLRVH